MGLIQHPEAALEYREAVRWYEREYRGRGARFYGDVEAAFARIRTEGAHTFPRWRRTTFRALVLDRFPFQVIFREEPAGVIVYAVAHDKRRPGYWKYRAAR